MMQRLWRVWRFILFLPTIFTEASSLRDNPVIGSRRLNQWGLLSLRQRVAHALAAWRRYWLAKRISAEDRQQFEANGFILKPNFLPPDQFQAIVNELQHWQGEARDTKQGDTVTRRFALDAVVCRQLPALSQLLAQPSYRALLDYVASFSSPPLHYIQAIHSGLPAKRPDPQRHLHSDTFHPTMKAWLFLTDVPAEVGAFTYVPGSHLLTPRRLAWDKAMSCRTQFPDAMSHKGSFRIKPSELASIGLPPPVALAVPANTLVVADTFGFHARGPAQGRAVRVEIWSYSRRNPFLPWTGAGITSLPWFRDRLVHSLWAVRDWAERRGWRKNPWRPVGLKSPMTDDL